ncbi:hypothetical protein PSE_1824 [Pseudovibrio sp. FO-BEG1]|nr:hypothetical protein PSE_1824 [Pseudovibrio sp. FO-BEG1]
MMANLDLVACSANKHSLRYTRGYSKYSKEAITLT